MATPITNDSDIEGLKAKQANVDAYKAAYPDKPKAAPVPPFGKTSPADKVNPKAKYGDRPGEKRIDTSDMLKKLPSYKHGTEYVPKTGPAILHKGEKVVTEKDNMKDKVYGKVTEGDHKPSKKLRAIHTSKTHDGKYIHRHEHHHSEHHPDETHVSNDAKEMAEHMTANAGGEGMTATPPPAGPAGMPGGATGGAQAQDQALGM